MLKSKSRIFRQLKVGGAVAVALYSLLRADQTFAQTLDMVWPKLTLESTTNRKVHIPDDFKGKWTILFFYPQDLSEGCTKEAADFNTNLSSFKKRGIEVFGVNSGSMATHKKFADQLTLSFPLLVDAGSDLARKLSSQLGGTISRDTFLIDPEAKIRKAWRDVSFSNHAATVYEEALPIVKKK